MFSAKFFLSHHFAWASLQPRGGEMRWPSPRGTGLSRLKGLTHSWSWMSYGQIQAVLVALWPTVPPAWQEPENLPPNSHFPWSLSFRPLTLMATSCDSDASGISNIRSPVGALDGKSHTFHSRALLSSPAPPLHLMLETRKKATVI